MGGVVSSLTARNAGAVLFSPANLSSLRLWHDFDGETGIDGSTLTTCTDLSGNGFNSTGGTPGTLKHSQIGGRKALRLVAASSQGYGMTAYGTILPSATEASMMAVIQRTDDPAGSSGAGGPIVGCYRGTFNPSAFPWTDGHVYETFGNQSQRDCGNPTPSLTSPRIYSVHSKNSDFRAYLDGTNLFTTGTNTFDVSYTGATGALGSSGTGAFFNGYIGAVFIFNSILTTTERQKMEGYLAHRFGLTANLPGGHPYISSPP